MRMEESTSSSSFFFFQNIEEEKEGAVRGVLLSLFSLFSAPPSGFARSQKRARAKKNLRENHGLRAFRERWRRLRGVKRSRTGRERSVAKSLALNTHFQYKIEAQCE